MMKYGENVPHPQEITDIIERLQSGPVNISVLLNESSNQARLVPVLRIMLENKLIRLCKDRIDWIELV